MLVYTNLLKRDYEVTYTLREHEDSINYGRVYKSIVKDCYTSSEAWDKWMEQTEWNWSDIDELDVEAIVKTKAQRVNEQVYELVLADLFDGFIGVFEYVDIRNADEYEITEQLEGIERMMIEHEAYNKYVNTKINNQ